jgi:hypothetical protein
MKNVKLVFVLISFIGIFSCEKNKSCEDNNIDVEYNYEVENFVTHLKANQYDSANLPVFTNQDIPALLQYRNEKQSISNFPRNPISSLYAPDCKLGMFILWTIESIRSVAIESDYLIIRFPSQNPILALRASAELELVYDDESLSIAAQAYYDWWYSHGCMIFDEFKGIDPLAKTAYRWH